MCDPLRHDKTGAGTQTCFNLSTTRTRRISGMILEGRAQKFEDTSTCEHLEIERMREENPLTRSEHNQGMKETRQRNKRNSQNTNLNPSTTYTQELSSTRNLGTSVIQEKCSAKPTISFFNFQQTEIKYATSLFVN